MFHITFQLKTFEVEVLGIDSWAFSMFGSVLYGRAVALPLPEDS